MTLATTPDDLTCAECGDPVTEQGYLPAVEAGDDEYDPRPEAALCGACGFNEVGFAGCAPELDDVVDPGPDDVLLHVAVSGGDVEVRTVKD